MLDRRIGEIDIVVVDTETTGLEPTSYIVEIGAVKLRGGRLIDTFSHVLRPPVPIPKEVIKIHGISDEVVRSAPTFFQIVDKFFRFIDGALLAAHNAPFDLKILCSNIKRAERKLPENPVIDTCGSLRNLFPNLPSYSLKYLAKYWKSPYKNFHRALSDAAHTAYILHSAMEKCGITQESTVEELLKLFGPPYYFSQFEGVWTPKDPQTTVEKIIKAIETDSDLVFTYLNGRELKRRVVPLNLFNNHNRWYLRALCLIDEKEKFFRVDRIKDIRIVEKCVR